ncbi:MAG: 7-cyano-7-deazaguanine synthase QueC [Fimbriimonadaceae bacterium]|nr:MAG: 7-cyano-7-deazaguanine synthase QueC [Fimbriimonadaceae bacterium]
MSKNAVILLSGGLDSATCLAIAKSRGFTLYCLTIQYGQRHEIELESARLIANSMEAKEHKIIEVDLSAFGGSALTDDIPVPKDSLSEEIPVTYVPARNTVMLSLALAYAETRQANDIYVGVNAVDYSGYPDCRPEFINAFQNLARLATKSGVSGEEIVIHAPLIQMTKPEIIRTGLQLGVDYGLTHSCYDPVDGRPCEHCDSCLIRMKAFAEIGMVDPALQR